MALQDKLFPAGASVRLLTQADDMQTPHAQRSNGTIIACLRDGSFECAVELASVDAAEPTLLRVRLSSLRAPFECRDGDRGMPYEDANTYAAAATRSCDGSLEFASPTLALPLDEAAVGQMMTDGVMEYHQLMAAKALDPLVSELGDTAFDDMPYAALLLVFKRLHAACCTALRGGDHASAVLVVEQALELERQARHEHMEIYELPLFVRDTLAQYHHILAAVNAARSDVDGAREAATAARRLSMRESVSVRKLQMALSPMQQQRPKAQPGLTVDEILQLQRWWHHVLTLYAGVGESAARERENARPGKRTQRITTATPRP